MSLSIQKIKKSNWTLDLVRPFSLFGVSLWHEWYDSSFAQEILGIGTPDALFIEESKDVFRYYKKLLQLKNLNESTRAIILNSKKVLAIFQDAIKLNKKAGHLLVGRNKISNFKKLIDFYIELALKATVLPYRIQYFTENDLNRIDPKVLKLAMKLRAESYYPKILERVVIPSAVRELQRHGVKNAHKLIEVITYRELHEQKYKKAEKRLKREQLFLYLIEKEHEYVFTTKGIEKIISVLEPIRATSKITGSIAFSGKAIGLVRIVNERNISKSNFDRGNILVSVSTSPIYLPLMRKAAAIIADEGGLTSHAAILSRELKKPCIIGTKIATKVFKDGDWVEVDAERGIVKLLKRKK